MVMALKLSVASGKLCVLFNVDCARCVCSGIELNGLATGMLDNVAAGPSNISNGALFAFLRQLQSTVYHFM